jgi:methylmalonyl-CoA mutase
LTLTPALRAALLEHGRGDIMIVIGGVIPPEDVDKLKEMGAAAVYPPGGVIADIAQDLLSALNQRLGYAQPPRKS